MFRRYQSCIKQRGRSEDFVWRQPHCGYFQRRTRGDVLSRQHRRGIRRIHRAATSLEM